MFDYLISAANIMGLAACVYIAYLFFVHARAIGSGARQNRAKVKRDADSGERYAANPRPDYYYVM